MRKLFRLVGAAVLGSVLLVGCQKKETTTTETTPETAATPEATPGGTYDTTPPMGMTPTPIP
jgi:hypothetical protein